VLTNGDVLSRTQLARHFEPLEHQRRPGPEALGPLHAEIQQIRRYFAPAGPGSAQCCPAELC